MINSKKIEIIIVCQIHLFIQIHSDSSRFIQTMSEDELYAFGYGIDNDVDNDDVDYDIFDEKYPFVPDYTPLSVFGNAYAQLHTNDKLKLKPEPSNLNDNDQLILECSHAMYGEVKRLVQLNKSLVNYEDSNGVTPLIAACEYTHYEPDLERRKSIIKYLIENGAIPNDYFMIQFARNMRVDNLEWIYELLVNCNVLSYVDEDYMIKQMSNYGINYGTFKLIIDNYPYSDLMRCLLNVIDVKYMYNDILHRIEYLMTKRANINFKCDGDPFFNMICRMPLLPITPHSQSKRRTINALVKHVNNLNWADSKGRTALMIMLKFGNDIDTIDNIKLLIDHGAKLDLRDKGDHSVLSYWIQFVDKYIDHNMALNTSGRVVWKPNGNPQTKRLNDIIELIDDIMESFADCDDICDQDLCLTAIDKCNLITKKIIGKYFN